MRSLANGIDTRFSRILTPDKSQPAIDPGDLVLVTLESVEINRLYSRDVTIRSRPGAVPRGLQPVSPKARREGTLHVQVGAIGGGKAAKIFNWRTDEKGEVVQSSDLEGTVLYYGAAPAGLDLSVQLIESDQEDREGLDTAKKTLAYLKTASSLVPTHGAAVNLGLGLLDSLFNLMKTTVKDSLELYHAGSVGIPDGQTPYLREGEYSVIRHFKKNPGDPVSDNEKHIIVKFKVTRIPAPPDSLKKQKVAVLVDRLALETEDVARTLMFESVFGSGRTASGYSFSSPTYEIFRGRAGST